MLSCLPLPLAPPHRSLSGQFAGIPGIVSLSGGFPPPSLFPLAGIQLQLAGGGSVNISDVRALCLGLCASSLPGCVSEGLCAMPAFVCAAMCQLKQHACLRLLLSCPPEAVTLPSCTPLLCLAAGAPTHLLTASPSLLQLTAAQQYNFSLRGYAPLLSWAERHTAAMHAPPPGAGHQVLVTNGGNHTLEVGQAGGQMGAASPLRLPLPAPALVFVAAAPSTGLRRVELRQVCHQASAIRLQTSTDSGYPPPATRR